MRVGQTATVIPSYEIEHRKLQCIVGCSGIVLKVKAEDCMVLLDAPLKGEVIKLRKTSLSDL